MHADEDEKKEDAAEIVQEEAPVEPTDGGEEEATSTVEATEGGDVATETSETTVAAGLEL